MKRLIAWCALLLISAAHAEKGSIWAEAQISELRPYVQQSVVYMVIVISRAPLDYPPVPVVPTVDGALLERLDEQPLNYPFSMEGRHYVITGFRYALTPLTLGTLVIPPAQVNVSVRNWQTGTVQQLELKTDPLNLDVQAPVAADGKWLPLSSLKITGKFEPPAAPLEVGEPVTLTLILDGEGGSQLPSLEALLRDTPGVKVYPERPSVTRDVVRNGSIYTLRTRRREVYTLIPQHAGTLKLPKLQVHWWNVRSKQAAVASWQAPEMQVGASSALPPSGQLPEREPSPIARANLLFWLGAGAFALFLSGFWIGAGFPGSEYALAGARRLRASLRALSDGMHHALQQQRSRLQQRVRRLLPAPLRARRRLAFGSVLAWWLIPRRLRMFWRLHQLQQCVSAAECMHHLQGFGADFLQLPANVPLRQIGIALSIQYPQLDRSAVQALMRELDAMCYGKTTTLADLAQWQTDFLHICYFVPFYRTKGVLRPSPQALPALNPRPVALDVMSLL